MSHTGAGAVLPAPDCSVSISGAGVACDVDQLGLAAAVLLTTAVERDDEDEGLTRQNTLMEPLMFCSSLWSCRLCRRDAEHMHIQA